MYVSAGRWGRQGLGFLKHNMPITFNTRRIAGKCWESTELGQSCGNASGLVWHRVGSMKQLLQNFTLNSPRDTRCGRESGGYSRKEKPGPFAWPPRMELVWGRQPAKELYVQRAIPTATLLFMERRHLEIVPSTATWEMRGIFLQLSELNLKAVYEQLRYLLRELCTSWTQNCTNRKTEVPLKFLTSKPGVDLGDKNHRRKQNFEAILPFGSHRNFSTHFHRSKLEIQDLKNNKHLS